MENIYQSAHYLDPQDGTPVCCECGCPIGEAAETCWNCALAVHETINTKLAGVIGCIDEENEFVDFFCVLEWYNGLSDEAKEYGGE